MSRVWEVETESHTEKLVLLALADNANDHGVCWPSMRTLAMKCNMTEQGVRYKLNDLIKRGWVYKSSNTNGYKSNQYTIRIPANATIAQRPPLPNGIRPDSPKGLLSLPNNVRPNHQGTAKEPPRGEDEVPVKPVEQYLSLEAESDSPKTSSPAVSQDDPEPPEAKFWNANRGTLPKVMCVAGKRLRALEARRKSAFWVANFQKGVKRAAESDWCTGRGGNGWQVDFDWLLIEGNLAKVVEGKYDNRGGPVRPTPTGEKDILLAALR